MIFRKILIKMFLCKCDHNYGVKNLREMEYPKVVGRCLRCNKRVYGKIFYENNKSSQDNTKTSGESK